MVRPSPYIVFTHGSSASKEISLSFGELPLTTYPSFKNHILHRIGSLQMSPTIQLGKSSFIAIRLPLPESSVISDFSKSRQSALMALPE